MEDSNKYKHIAVQGVNCIVCLFNTNENEISKSAKRARRKEKDDVGRQNPDIPMLDTTKHGTSRAYCDIIVYTNSIKEWECAIRKKFINFHQKTRRITGGEQISFTSSTDGHLFVTVNLYSCTKKLMIQPGNRDESNLLGWLSHFNEMKIAVCGSCPPPVSSAKPESVPDAVHNINISLRSLSPECPTSNPDFIHGETAVKEVFMTPASVCNWSSVSTSSPVNPASTTRILFSSPIVSQSAHSVQTERISTVAQPEHAQSHTTRENSPPSSTCLQSARNIHVDELLFFIQNKIETTNMETIIPIVTEFYSETDIENSKATLYAITQPKDRCIKRRGQNKARENVKDICTVFYTTELQRQPLFVAMSLTKLPPITTHDVGVGRILRELDSVKMCLRNLETCCRPAVVANDHVDGYNGCTSDTNCNRTARRETCVSVPVQCDPCVMEAASKCVQTSVTEMDCSNVFDHTTDDEFITIDEVANISVLDDTLYSEFSTSDFSQFMQDLNEQTAADEVSSQVLPQSPNTQWSMVTNKRPRRAHGHVRNSSVIYGTGMAANVRSTVRYNTPDRRNLVFKSHNTDVTGVFVTRLQSSTTTNQIKKLICSNTALLCSPVKLKTRYGGYSSFYIPADRNMRHKLMDPQIWPHGTLVKPFRR